MTWIKTGAAPDAIMRLMNTRFARLMFLALGLIAVSALLIQPICEAAERQAAQAGDASHVAASGDEGDTCCSITALEAVAASPLASGPNIPAAVPAVAAPVFRRQIVIFDALPAAAPPLVSRYYARSARIQR